MLFFFIIVFYISVDLVKLEGSGVLLGVVELLCIFVSAVPGAN